MSIDIRIDVGFLDHPKTVKLERRLGVQGIKSLIALWLWCRANKPCGNLEGMDEEDIEIASRWTGEPGEFVKECLTLRWIDVNGPLTENNAVTYSLHDWDDHNPWAAGAEARSNASRFNRMAKTHPEIYKKLKDNGKTEITSEEFRELTQQQTKNNEPLTTVNAGLSPAPSPAPAPSPMELKALGEKHAVFSPPTIDQVSAYCQERCNSVDPQRWHDHYTSNGWVVGKAKMKDWKAAVRTWEKNGYSNGKPEKKDTHNGFDKRDYQSGATSPESLPAFLR